MKRLHQTAIVTLIAMVAIACLIVLAALPHWAFELALAAGIVAFFGWHAWTGGEGGAAYIMAGFAAVLAISGSIEFGLSAEVVVGWGLTSGLALAGFVADHKPTKS